MTTLLSIGSSSYCDWANPTWLLDEDPPESKPLLEKVKELPLFQLPSLTSFGPLGHLPTCCCYSSPPQHMPLLFMPSSFAPMQAGLLSYLSQGPYLHPARASFPERALSRVQTFCLAREWRSWPAHMRSLGQCVREALTELVQKKSGIKKTQPVQ